jgi:hypothetical protein
MFNHIKENYHQFLVAIFAIVWAGICLYIIQGHTNRTVAFDCRLSEISPDFPPEVKEACRKMRAQSGRI